MSEESLGTSKSKRKQGSNHMLWMQEAWICKVKMFSPQQCEKGSYGGNAGWQWWRDLKWGGIT